MLSFKSMWGGLLESTRTEFLVTQQGRMTKGELTSLVSGMLAAFDANGLVPGDRVLILTGNEGAAITAFIAALLDGLVPVMLTPDTREARAATVVQSVGPGLIVADETRLGEGWKGVHPALAVQPINSAPAGRVFRFKRRIPWGLDLPKGGREPRLPESSDDLAYLLFTSGTTQAPTGVMLTRRNILANLSTLSRLEECTPQTRLFNDMVLAHADGLVQGPLLALANSCVLIRAGGFSVPGMEAWLNRLRKERATHVITVPTIWSIIDRYAQHDDYFDAPECSHLISVAARLDPELWRRMETRFKRPVFNQYGLTETVTSALYAGPHPEMGAYGTIGLPVDCEARLETYANGTMNEGELLLRGDNVFAGYWQNTARSQESFTADGWMRTGDLARRREDGSYEIKGRIKTVIMSGGNLIRPEEIDEVMAAHPAVAQSVTVAMPDADFGEIPVTAVSLDWEVDEATLTSHARTHLEALKVPKRIVALADIPRGDAGKPRLDKLRVILAAVIEGKFESKIEGPTNDIFSVVRKLAAEIFRVDPESLQPSSCPETVPGWDSFSHITLIIATEERFSIRIPVTKVAGVRSLGELHSVVNALRA